MPELSGREDIARPFFKIGKSQIIARTHDSAFVDPTNELDDNFFGAMIINDFELPDVSVGLHKFEELDDEFGDGSDENLFFALPFGIDDGFEAVGKDVHFHH